MTVPGIPFIIIGRTPHHAWSMQVGHAHTVDYYIEDAEDVTTPHRMETIHVAGEADVVLPVYRTVHGPVVNPVPYNPATYDSGNDGPIDAPVTNPLSQTVSATDRVIVATAPDGRRVYLKDIATVRDKWSDNPNRTYVNGRAAVAISVSTQTRNIGTSTTG